MILLARHGETDWNVAPQRIMGWRDEPLNERGREQARALARELRGERLALVRTSQLARARETAEIVAAALGIEVVVDERLAESRRGDWEGRLAGDVEREQPEAWAAWRRADADFRFPGGESLAEHSRRVAAALEDAAAGPLPVLCVCHGGSVRCAIALSDPRGFGAFHELEVPNAKPLRLPGDSA